MKNIGFSAKEAMHPTNRIKKMATVVIVAKRLYLILDFMGYIFYKDSFLIVGVITLHYVLLSLLNDSFSLSMSGIL